MGWCRIVFSSFALFLFFLFFVSFFSFSSAACAGRPGARRRLFDGAWHDASHAHRGGVTISVPGLKEQ